MTATESWGKLDFTVTNPADFDRQARVLLNYEGQPDVQYGRDVWVPARSTLASWVLVGPAPAQRSGIGREIQFLLYERVGGKDRLVLPPGELRLRSRAVAYHPRKEFTSILLDEDDSADGITPEESGFVRLPRVVSRADESLLLAQSFRHALALLSDHVQVVNPHSMPSTAEAYDGIDHFILASDRLALDSAGMLALRRWLQQGGRVWVMLDQVGPELVASLLGDAYDFQIVDRSNLTDLTMEAYSVFGEVRKLPAQRHERPVEFVRVLLPPHERVRHTIDGWPTWFSRKVGKGTVVLTTLGPRGWFRPRVQTDPPSPYENAPTFPVPLQPLEDMAFTLRPTPERHPFSVNSFKELLAGEIGYSVISQGLVTLIFGGALLAALLFGFVLNRSGRRELLGWVGPAVAVGAAAVFFILGEASRRQAPPTVAVGQVVYAGTAQEEAAASGLLAVYRPVSGQTEAGADKGGFFDLDMAGTEGRTRRRIVTDMDAWHWENLGLPAGVRFAPFQATVRTGRPITATARFGPEGLEGELKAELFRGLGDAVLIPPGGRNLAVQLGPDGAFRAGGPDALPAGQFMAAAVLSERQQRRQDIYREFLRAPEKVVPKENSVLLAWGEPLDMGFTLGGQGRRAGDSLLVVPLRLERPAPGARVTIPGPLLTYWRILVSNQTAGPTPPNMGSSEAADQQIRFQLPPQVLPFKVERARLVAKINALSRRVVIAGYAEGGPVEIYHTESPLGPIQVEITDERLLRLDPGGGLHVAVNTSGGERRPGEIRRPEAWTMEYLELEVTGRTVDEKGPR
jgi:hypothetical protein